MEHDWIVTFRKAHPIGRVICIPHAGGGADYFAPLRAELPDDVELTVIEYPGHGSNRREPPIREFNEMVAALVGVIEHLTDLPFVLFGHSMGGLLAFEVAREQQRLGKNLPIHMYLSSSKAPVNLPSRFVLEAVKLPDQAFLSRVESLGGLPGEIMEHVELQTLVAKLLRNDFDLLSKYRYVPGPRIPVPISVLYGRDDGHITPDTLADWRLETVEPPEIRAMPGGHFYFQDPATLAGIGSELGVHFKALIQTQLI